MLNPTTPGVSVDEITKLPYSISLIDTAMPAFIGYTELIPDHYDKPFPISSLLEYEKYFGKAKKEDIHLKDVEGRGITVVMPPVQFLMYYSLQMYFSNGGGPCYIIPVGNYVSEEVQLSPLKGGLDLIEGIKKPLLIVFPDALSLTEPDFYSLYNHTIEKIQTDKRNWFAILDTYYGSSTASPDTPTTVENFRAEVSQTSHAAAYFPHLKTILNYTFDSQAIITHKGLQDGQVNNNSFYANEIAVLQELKRLANDEILFASANVFVLADLLGQAMAIVKEINETADQEIGLAEPAAIVEAIENGTIDSIDLSFLNEFDQLINDVSDAQDIVGNADGVTLENLQVSDSLLYSQVKEAIKSLKVILPPSSAMAGVYGRVDSTRGVWKAPANVSLNYVIAPTEKVSEQEQSELNIHGTGKSINAIRTFTGKGTLVWGARTLDGKDKNEDQDNEWKYVHVRRYYDMIEQSVNHALTKFIDQPNIPHTWLHAKTMIENFLNQQWINGALVGNTPKEAYEVKVYGSKDPVTDDITNVMNVEIKVALVRPAEFIILNFSHKLQQ